MPDNPGTFQPLGDSTRRLPGCPALLVSGLATAADQDRLLQVCATAGLAALPVIFVTEALAGQTLDALARQPHRTGYGQPSALNGAVIMSGLTEAELHRLMAAHRAAELPRAHWAALTPVNASWPLAALLVELQREREAIRAAMQQQNLI
jgi:hypothetical protein